MWCRYYIIHVGIQYYCMFIIRLTPEKEYVDPREMHFCERVLNDIDSEGLARFVVILYYYWYILYNLCPCYKL